MLFPLTTDKLTEGQIVSSSTYSDELNKLSRNNATDKKNVDN
jgi:hypothetical protein